MNRYIDSLKLVEDVEMSKKFNPHEDPVKRAMHNHEHEHFFTLIARQPVVEVAPMAEVKLLREKLASARKAKAEVAREIFEEIRDLIHFTMKHGDTALYAEIEFEKIEELKKKYTEE